MTYLPGRRFVMLAALASSAVLSFACVTLMGGGPGAGASPTGAPADEMVEPATSSFDYPNSLSGLEGLSSFRATLVVSFDGTEAGEPQPWASTHVFTYQKEPLARMLTFETTAEGRGSEPPFRAELNNTLYEQGLDGVCTAAPFDPANSVIEYMHPGIALYGVHGARPAGHETVNGVEADHYTFDERAISQRNLDGAAGELWIASDGGYLVRYYLTTTGGEQAFGAGIVGTYTTSYDLTEVNQPVTFELPADCPPAP